MKKGVTLIELIFTIVIIGIVFTVIPKMVLSLQKSDDFTIRQDALFNGFSMINLISTLDWDKNSTLNNNILHINSSSHNSNLDCNSSTNYRKGGFSGSRECNDNNYSSAIINYPHDVNYSMSYIDGFNDVDVEANATIGTDELKYYDLNDTVYYIDDNIITYNNQIATINLNSSKVNHTTNLKYIDVNISYGGARGGPRPLSQFNYTSANIGKMKFYRRMWR